MTKFMKCLLTKVTYLDSTLHYAFHVKIETIFTRLPYRFFTRYENITLKRDTLFLNILD